MATLQVIWVLTISFRSRLNPQVRAFTTPWLLSITALAAFDGIFPFGGRDFQRVNISWTNAYPVPC